MKPFVAIATAMVGLGLALPVTTTPADSRDGATVIIKRDRDRGRHLGWTRGRHLGWAHSRHQAGNRVVIIKRGSRHGSY